MTSASQRFNTALNNSARAKQEGRKEGARARLFASNSWRRPLRPTPAPRTNLWSTPTINSKEKCKKVSLFFLMGAQGTGQSRNICLRHTQGRFLGDV